jgi:hypothetical protein
MAIQTRYVGDSQPVDNVDLGPSYGYPNTGSIVATGLTKAPIALKIVNQTGNLAQEMVTGGAVESVLRQLNIDGTVTMYQVETTGTQISVLVEASGAGPANSGYGAQSYSPSTIATALQTRLQAMVGAASGAAGPQGSTTGGNVGISSNVWAANTTVTSSGFKLA